ncbi:MAG: outer membrane beta-barrel protein [Candidatus Krumholzibacteriia bacterium]
MKTWFVAAMIVVIAAGGARAGSRPRIQVNGSLAIPLNPDGFTDGYILGFGGGIGAEIALSPSAKISGTVDFTTFDLDAGGYLASQKLAAPSSIVGGEVSVLYASGNLKWNVLLPSENILRPYVLLGAGYFRMATDDIVSPGSRIHRDTEHVFGAHGGAGIDIALGSAIGLFFDALYVFGITDNESTGYLPVRVGLSFDLVPQL